MTCVWSTAFDQNQTAATSRRSCVTPLPPHLKPIACPALFVFHQTHFRQTLHSNLVRIPVLSSTLVRPRLDQFQRQASPELVSTRCRPTMITMATMMAVITMMTVTTRNTALTMMTRTNAIRIPTTTTPTITNPKPPTSTITPRKKRTSAIRSRTTHPPVHRTTARRTPTTSGPKDPTMAIYSRTQQRPALSHLSNQRMARQRIPHQRRRRRELIQRKHLHDDNLHAQLVHKHLAVRPNLHTQLVHSHLSVRPNLQQTLHHHRPRHQFPGKFPHKTPTKPNILLIITNRAITGATATTAQTSQTKTATTTPIAMGAITMPIRMVGTHSLANVMRRKHMLTRSRLDVLQQRPRRQLVHATSAGRREEVISAGEFTSNASLHHDR